MADTKKSIRALAAKFRGVLDGDSVQDQTRDEIVADAKSEGYQSRDDDVSEVSSLESEVSEESEWGVSELAGFYNSEQLKRLEQIISETMSIERDWESNDPWNSLSLDVRSDYYYLLISGIRR